MPFPTAAAAADPTDPASQIAWPGRKLSGASIVSADQERRAADGCRRREPSKYGGDADALNENDTSVPGVNRLTKWNLFTVSLGMAGSQVAWTVELGYVATSRADCRGCAEFSVHVAMAPRSS